MCKVINFDIVELKYTLKIILELPHSIFLMVAMETSIAIATD
jgi:hypothetical protein